MTDAGVDGEEEKEEGDEEVDGVHGERRGGRRGVEGALNAEVGEGRFVVVVHLRVNRAASSDAKESGTVQLGDRHQRGGEWREEGSVDDRFQHEHGSEDAEREVRRHGQQQRHGDANDVVDHAVDALQRGEVGGLERIGLDAPERQLHDFADVELGVELRVIRVSPLRESSRMPHTAARTGCTCRQRSARPVGFRTARRATSETRRRR